MHAALPKERASGGTSTALASNLAATILRIVDLQGGGLKRLDDQFRRRRGGPNCLITLSE
jgi:hypothetical protein